MRRHRSMSITAAALVALALVGGACSNDPVAGSGATGTGATGTTKVAPAAPGTTKAATGTTKAATGTTAPVTPGPVTLEVVETPFGSVIGTPDGLAVYTWDTEIDAGNEVKCVDAECVEKWPPVLATSVTAGDGVATTGLSVITRPDGSTQAAINGSPLYTMAEDGPGEALCQGGEGWWIVNPDGTKNVDTTPS